MASESEMTKKGNSIKLQCKSCNDWKPITVILPKPGELGVIEIAAEANEEIHVYGVDENNPDVDVKEMVLNSDDPHQRWYRGYSNIEDYFALQKFGTQSILTASESGALKIQGKFILKNINMYCN